MKRTITFFLINRIILDKFNFDRTKYGLKNTNILNFVFRKFYMGIVRGLCRDLEIVPKLQYILLC